MEKNTVMVGNAALKLMNGRATCLEKAKRKAVGYKDNNNSRPENNLEQIAIYWRAFIKNQFGLDLKITSEHVALMMELMKIARIQGGHSVEDSYVDACGYLACGYEIRFGDATEEDGEE